MNYFSKIKIGAWLVIILTAINIATLVTILYKNHEQKSRVEKSEVKPKKQGIKHYLKEEVKLTDEQQAFYNASLCTYFESSVAIFRSQEELRLKIIEELSTEYPDTTKLFALSSAMGKNYVQLKKDIIIHFVNCRNISDPKQKKMLDPLYSRLMGPEGSCDIKKKEAFCDQKKDSIN